MAGFGLGSLGPAGYVGAALDVAGLFGGGGGNNNYANDRARGDMYAGKIADNGSTWQGFGNTALNQYGTDNAAARNATQKQVAYYSQDPTTDSRYAADLGRATSGLDTGVQSAQNQAIARSSATGNLSAAGGGSSAASGAQSYLSGLGILGKQSAQVGVANQNRQLRESNMANVAGLENNLASGDYSKAQYGIGTATQDAGIGLNDARNQEAADYQRDLASSQSSLAGLGGLGQVLGMAAGSQGGGAAPPAGNIATASSLLPASTGDYYYGKGGPVSNSQYGTQFDQYGYPVMPTR